MMRQFFLLALLAGGCARELPEASIPAEPIGKVDRPYTAIPSYLQASSKPPPKCDCDVPAKPAPSDQERPE